jgi:hypothetical protein
MRIDANGLRTFPISTGEKAVSDAGFLMRAPLRYIRVARGIVTRAGLQRRPVVGHTAAFARAVLLRHGGRRPVVHPLIALCVARSALRSSPATRTGTTTGQICGSTLACSRYCVSVNFFAHSLPGGSRGWRLRPPRPHGVRPIS